MRRFIFLMLAGSLIAAACGSPEASDAVTATSSASTTQPPTTQSEATSTSTTTDPGGSVPTTDRKCLVPTEQGQHDGCLVHDGIVRRYLIQVPASYDPATPAPVVMFFHGGGGNRKGVYRTGIFREARDRGWLAVSPEGADFSRLVESGEPGEEGYTWNAVNCCGLALRHDVDDVGFVRALVSELADAFEIDPKRVYATGFSNGAMLVHRIGSELSDIIAAVAPAAGTVGGAPDESSPTVTIAAPPRPVPILLMHGMKDTHVHFAGGKNFRDRIDLSFQESAAFWGAANGCDPSPVRTDQAWGVHAVFENCDEPGDVVANAYSEMGHAFPTIAKDAGVDGAVQVMDFFAVHTLP